jgi:hypothetical protein
MHPSGNPPTQYTTNEHSSKHVCPTRPGNLQQGQEGDVGCTQPVLGSPDRPDIISNIPDHGCISPGYYHKTSPWVGPRFHQYGNIVHFTRLQFYQWLCGGRFVMTIGMIVIMGLLRKDLNAGEKR